jgi:hypothetical protein
MSKRSFSCIETSDLQQQFKKIKTDDDINNSIIPCDNSEKKIILDKIIHNKRDDEKDEVMCNEESIPLYPKREKMDPITKKMISELINFLLINTMNSETEKIISNFIEFLIVNEHKRDLDRRKNQQLEKKIDLLNSETKLKLGEINEKIDIMEYDIKEIKYNSIQSNMYLCDDHSKSWTCSYIN